MWQPCKFSFATPAPSQSSLTVIFYSLNSPHTQNNKTIEGSRQTKRKCLNLSQFSLSRSLLPLLASHHGTAVPKLTLSLERELCLCLCEVGEISFEVEEGRVRAQSVCFIQLLWFSSSQPFFFTKKNFLLLPACYFCLCSPRSLSRGGEFFFSCWYSETSANCLTADDCLCWKRMREGKKMRKCLFYTNFFCTLLKKIKYSKTLDQKGWNLQLVKTLFVHFARTFSKKFFWMWE